MSHPGVLQVISLTESKQAAGQIDLGYHCSHPELERLFEQHSEVLPQIPEGLLVPGYRYSHQQICFSPPHGLSLTEVADHKLNLSAKLRLAIVLAEQLDQWHGQNLLCLNLRPESFYLSADLEHAWLIDLSATQIWPTDSDSVKSARPLIADPQFLAPEQGYQYQHRLDNRTDLYAFGAVLYWLFYEQVLFPKHTTQDAISYAHIAQSPDFSQLLTPPDLIDHAALEAVLSRLLHKDPDQRYQSVLGVIQDLQQLLESPVLQRFQSGEQDTPERLVIPQRLYGREQELERLLNSFAEVKKGPSQALLVAGYSGVGKSALVYELRKPILKENGLFVHGKFDQYQNSTPYSAIVQAFSHFIRNLLSAPSDKYEFWRRKLTDALYPNAQALIDLIPELGVLLGEQPALVPLGGDEQQHRFNRVFLKFMHAICTEHKPLVIFIDDLQWADLASINLMRLILSDSESRYCLLLGAYRDNEVDERHPFMRMLLDLNEQHRLQQIELKPLRKVHLEQVVADALRLKKTQVTGLASVVYEKTVGNPFFFRQFLQEIYHQQALRFERDKGRWHWSLDKIRQRHITENVVDLMVSKISRLPRDTQALLQLISCVGNAAELGLLQRVADIAYDIQRMLAPAIQMGLLVPQGGDDQGYAAVKFLHDRVQQAAYGLLDQEQRLGLHYRIGLEMLHGLTPKEWGAYCFDILAHLNPAITLADESLQGKLITLNNMAADKAISATAYQPALGYLDQQIALLLSSESVATEDGQIMAASLKRLECLYLAGEFEQAETYLSALRTQALNDQQQLSLNIILITQYTRYGHLDRAIAEGLKGLQAEGYPLPEDPTMGDLGAAIAEIQGQLEATPFGQLVALPGVKDSHISRVLELLIAMQPCCYNSGSLLFPLTILNLQKLTMAYGNHPHSSYVYLMYGLLCTKVLKDYTTAFEAEAASREIAIEYPPSPLVEGRLKMMSANFVLPWQTHLQASTELRNCAYHACLEQGDYYWGVHAYIFGFYADLFVIPDLKLLQARTESVVETCQKIKQPAQVYVAQLQVNLLQILNGAVDNTSNLDHLPGFEAEACEHFEATNYMCGKYDRMLGRLLQGYLFGNYRNTLELSLSEETMSHLDEGIFHEAAYHLFNMLAVLALQQQGHTLPEAWLAWYQTSKQKIQNWVKLNPQNFTPIQALLEAEEAVLAGEKLHAFCAYEQAIAAAAESEMPLLKALGNERMGRFRLAANQTSLAHAYLDEAIQWYQCWGAYAKADEVECFKRGSERQRTGLSDSNFDWRGIVSASQDLSGVLATDELQEKILRWSATITGAERASLYCLNVHDWQREACFDSGTMVYETIELEHPVTVLNYCQHSGVVLRLSDACREGDYLLDPYIKARQCRSLLAVPLRLRDQVLAVLVLEHSQSSHLFSNKRQQIIALLAEQYGISYSNAQLYHVLQNHNQDLEKKVASRTAELAQKKEHLEAILEALPIPYVITEAEGRVISANHLLCEQFAVNEIELKSLNAIDFYHNSDDRLEMLRQLQEEGMVNDFECQLITAEGDLFWALFSARLIDLEGAPVIFAAISDISERKELEGALQKQANTDPLTSIFNRRAIFRMAKRYWQSHSDESVYVAMLDLDNFKQLNDRYSHAAGDEVLKVFTREISAMLRESDLFGRLGGEEFVVILSSAEIKQARMILERIRTHVAGLKVHYGEVEIDFTVSIGISQWRNGTKVDMALQRADIGLYQAKALGRNRVVFMEDSS